MDSQIQRTYRGITYFADSEESINKMIAEREYKKSIFSEGSVYTYSYHARQLNDGTVELIQFFNNGESKKITKFANKNEYYNQKN
ncbi:MAG: hypothetical protein V4549_07735 [Bacteroidota bacterium]